MILKYVKLSNIRSYSSQKIEFPTGSLLLSGDVGSGKSSILLGVEFALFGSVGTGSKRASMLLRNGKKRGYVELGFAVDGREVVIRRVLERTKSSVVQKPGYLVVGGVRTDLVPTELKARVLELLGYPEGLLAKKFSIYPYTVYTPQEEMKKILFEDSAHRTETLRKIFGVDRYAAVRKNAELVSRSIKMKKVELSSKASGVDEKRRELEAVSESHQQLKKKKALADFGVAGVEGKLLKEKEKLKRIEGMLENLRVLKASLVSAGASVKRERNFLDGLRRDAEKLDSEISLIENSSKSFEESRFKESLACLSHHISLLSSEAGYEDRITSEIQDVRSRIRSADDRIVEARTLQEQASRLERDVLESDVCVICRQKIERAHKDSFREKISADRSAASGVIKERDSEKRELEALLERKKSEHGDFLAREKALSDFKSRYEHYADQAGRNNISLGEHKGGSYDIKDVMGFLRESAVSLEQRRVESAVLEQKREQKGSRARQISKAEEDLRAFEAEESSVKKKLEGFESVEKENSVIRKKVEELEREKLVLSNSGARLGAEIESSQRSIVKMQGEIDEMVRVRVLMEKYSEYKNWIDSCLIPLSEVVEKTVMLKVHEQLDDKFQEWFRVLMEDESDLGEAGRVFRAFCGDRRV